MDSKPTKSFEAKQVEAIINIVAWFSDRFGISEDQIVDPERLRRLPLGTFGRYWIDAFDGYGFDVVGGGSRRLQLHDGVHILTGYQPDTLGEAEVQAFLMGAKFKVFHGVLLGQMLLMTRLTPLVVNKIKAERGHDFTFQQMRHHIQDAYRRGRRARLDPDDGRQSRFGNGP